MKKEKIIALSVLISLAIMVVLYFSNSEKENYDIIIVGTGLAGLTAAHESYKISEGTTKILLLDSQPSFGGNSKKATSGINLLGTPVQKFKKINDSYSLFYNDTYVSSGENGNANLISILVQESQNLYGFFHQLGVNLTYVDILGGHSLARTHRPNIGTIGYSLTSALFQRIAHESDIEIQFNSLVTDLLYDERHTRIEGVIVQNQGKLYKKYSKVVILCTGGFAHDFVSKDSLLREFSPGLLKFPTTNGIGSQGQGMKLARKIGAKLIGMKDIQIHPTAFVNLTNRFEKNKILAPELLRGVGGILINQKGNRFCNELGRRDYVTNKILENCEKIVDSNNNLNQQTEAFIVLNKKGIELYGKDAYFYISKGLLKEYKNLEEFSKEFKIELSNLIKTFEKYNSNTNDEKDEFFKDKFMLKFDVNETIYVGVITPAIHYTMGGVQINENTEVINNEDDIIDGLFAVGEVTGGLHGKNRLGGNSLLECAVFGRKAAESAFRYLSIIG